MTVEAANVRLSVIEQTWQAASAEERLGYLDELAAMAGTLGQVTGPQADNAEWLTRHLTASYDSHPCAGRVVRNRGCSHCLATRHHSVTCTYTF